MRTRREQMQAYRFVIRRIVAAVLSGEPETLDRPMRRLGLSLFVSVMVTVLVFAGFGIYGVLANPGGELTDGELVMDRDSGARYVYLDSTLHAVPNLVSGRLVIGEAAEPREVSGDSLVDRPHGAALGIPDAPDPAPQPEHLLGLPWRVCSEPPAVGSSETTTTVVIDHGLPGGSRLAGDQGVYVTTGDAHYLLWHDRRLRLPDPEVAERALGLPTEPVPVGEPLVNTISAGPDLAPPQVPDAGEDSGQELGGEPAAFGDLFVEGEDHYLLTPDGLARVGVVTVRLLEADGVTARPVSLAEIGSLAEDLEPPGFPQALPERHPSAAGSPTVCTAYIGDSEAGQLGTVLEVYDAAPAELSDAAGAREMAQGSEDPVAAADRVVISGGRGVLVQAVPHTAMATEGDTLYLVTDQGRRYPLGTEGGTDQVAARQALGYGDVDPVPVPEALLGMLPTGPVLSQAAALEPIR